MKTLLQILAKIGQVLFVPVGIVCSAIIFVVLLSLVSTTYRVLFVDGLTNVTTGDRLISLAGICFFALVYSAWGTWYEGECEE